MKTTSVPSQSYVEDFYPFSQSEFGSNQVTYTVALWWKPINFEGNMLIFTFGEYTNSALDLRILKFTGKFLMTVVGIQEISTNKAYLGTWQHIVCRKTHTKFELILNSIVKHTMTYSLGWPNTLAKVILFLSIYDLGCLP